MKKRLQILIEMSGDSALSAIGWDIQVSAGRTIQFNRLRTARRGALSSITTIIILISLRRTVSQLSDYLEFWLYATRISSETAW